MYMKHSKSDVLMTVAQLNGCSDKRNTIHLPCCIERISIIIDSRIRTIISISKHHQRVPYQNGTPFHIQIMMLNYLNSLSILILVVYLWEQCLIQREMNNTVQSLSSHSSLHLEFPTFVASDFRRMTCFSGVDTRKHRNRTVVCELWLSRNGRQCVFWWNALQYTRIHRHQYFFQCAVFPLWLSFVLPAVVVWLSSVCFTLARLCQWTGICFNHQENW